MLPRHERRPTIFAVIDSSSLVIRSRGPACVHDRVDVTTEIKESETDSTSMLTKRCCHMHLLSTRT